MNLILLAGNSISNKQWVEELAASLAKLFAKTTVHYYDHWTTGIGEIDINKEVEMLSREIKYSDKYAILAKSAGTVVALKGIKNNKLSPLKCIFVGTAVNWAYENNIDIGELLENYSVPTLFIQKTYDPAGSIVDLIELLQNKRVQNSSIKEIPGSNHHYDDIELLKAEIEKFKG